MNVKKRIRFLLLFILLIVLVSMSSSLVLSDNVTYSISPKQIEIVGALNKQIIESSFQVYASSLEDTFLELRTSSDSWIKLDQETLLIKDCLKQIVNFTIQVPKHLSTSDLIHKEVIDVVFLVDSNEILSKEIIFPLTVIVSTTKDKFVDLNLQSMTVISNSSSNYLEVSTTLCNKGNVKSKIWFTKLILFSGDKKIKQKFFFFNQQINPFSSKEKTFNLKRPSGPGVYRVELQFKQKHNSLVDTRVVIIK